MKTGLAFASLALVVFTAVGALSGSRVRSELTRHSGASLHHIAQRLAGAIDAGMFERFREIRNLAALQSLIGAQVNPQDWRSLAERMQATLPYYSWIGVTDTEGRVVAATGGVLQGRNVSSRPWFSQGLRGTYVGDVHEAVLLASLLPAASDQEPLRLVDFAAPVRLAGTTTGVLGAHLDMRWAEALRLAALSGSEVGREVDIVLLSRDGAVLLGSTAPRLLDDHGPTLAHLAAAAPGIHRWSDGADYLTAAAMTRGQGEYPGLGWVVLVRQPAATALAPALALQTRVWLYGLAGALLFGVAGWWLAGWLTAPLRALALQALRLAPLTSPSAESSRAPVSVVPGSTAHLARKTTTVTPRLYRLNEVAQLALSLSNVVEQLREREQALLDLTTDLEARVRARTASLDQANADLRSFGRSISHDLRGPIGAMAQMLALVLDSDRHPLTPETKAVLEVLQTECTRLASLVTELMALSQVEERALQQAPVDMQDLADAVLAELRDGRTQVTVASTLPTVRGDPVLLRQVWQNLLSNAFKFSAHSQPPQVTIACTSDEGKWLFSVSDNGAGFDVSEADHLFQPFHRLPGSGGYPGSGVGLSIVQRILKRHGGHVWADATPGKGATFFFTLPQS